MNIRELLEQTSEEAEFAEIRHDQLVAHYLELQQINNDLEFLEAALQRLEAKTDISATIDRSVIKAELRRLGE